MRDIQLHKPQEFFNRVDSYRKDLDISYLQAYRMAERDYKNIFGERKYSSYHSFKKCYNRK